MTEIGRIKFRELDVIEEGFAISCTTCGVSLKVQDASLMGQIMACPKCGSMVLVEPPDSEQSLTGEPTEEVSSQQPLGAALPSPQLAGIPLHFVFAVLLTGIVGIGSVSWLIWGRGTIPAGGTRPASGLASTEDWRPMPAGQPATSLAEEDDDVRDATPPTEARDEALIADSVPDELSDVAEETPVGDAPQARLTSDEDVARGVEEDFLGDDPLGQDILAADSLAADSPAVDPLTNSSRANRWSTDGSLANIARLLDGGSDLATAAASMSEENALERPVGVTTLANPAVSRASYAQTVDTGDVGQGPIIAQAQFEKVPLIDFCRTLQQLAGVPIQIDPVALRQSANVLETPVSVNGRDLTSLELLRRALEPIRMIPLQQQDVIRISSPRSEDRRVGSLSLYVGDLQGGRGRSLSIADLITTLVEPGTWGADGIQVEVKGERLHVQHTHAARIQTVVLLEKLRVARNLRPRKRLPARYTNLEPRWSRIERYLERPLKLDVWDERSLPQVLEVLEKASGLRIIADWMELAENGVTPQTSLTLYVRERPARQVFAELQAALADAVLVPVSGDAVQLTTRSARQREAYLEFYALDQLGADARRRIMQLDDRAASVIDPASDVAIVLAPADVQRSLVP